MGILTPRPKFTVDKQPNTLSDTFSPHHRSEELRTLFYLEKRGHAAPTRSADALRLPASSPAAVWGLCTPACSGLDGPNVPD